MRRSGLILALVLVWAGCSGGIGGDGAGTTAAVTDPAATVVGEWTWSNEVGSSTYRFAGDGTVTITTGNKFQRFDFDAHWRLDGDEVLIRLNDDEAGVEEERARFQGPDRLAITSSTGENVYDRQR